MHQSHFIMNKALTLTVALALALFEGVQTQKGKLNVCSYYIQVSLIFLEKNEYFCKSVSLSSIGSKFVGQNTKSLVDFFHQRRSSMVKGWVVIFFFFLFPRDIYLLA